MIDCARLMQCVFVVFAIIGATHASAQSWITGIPASGLRLYSEPDGAKGLKEPLKSTDVQLPLEIIDIDGDFGRIVTPKGPLWFELRRAQVKRSAAVECKKGLAQSRSQVSTAGTRGANDGC
jgi:hypothetical protein